MNAFHVGEHEIEVNWQRNDCEKDIEQCCAENNGVLRRCFMNLVLESWSLLTLKSLARIEKIMTMAH
jgi:hypothetical protein